MTSCVPATQPPLTVSMPAPASACRRRFGGPAQRAVRRAPAGRGDGHRHRRDARHDAERGPPAPHRARRRRPAARSARRPATPGQQGRSERIYCIAPAAEPLFPRAYGELTNQLLGYLPAGAVAARLRAPARRPHRRAPRPAWPASASFAAKVTELATILDEDGYLARVEPIGDGALPHRRAQLRHLRRRPRAPPGVLDRARVPARRPARGRDRAGHPHDGRRPLPAATRSAPAPDPSVCCSPSVCCGDVPAANTRWQQTLGWGTVRCRRAGSWGLRW